MVKLSDIELPMIFKDRLLFSHGVLNNWRIHASEVTKSMGITNWDDQKNRALFLSHTERDAQKWVGRIENPYVKDGELYGDLEIHDADLALKLGPGRAPLGVSAEIKWPKQYSDPTDFSYRSFAMVPNPEVPETMINFSEEEVKEEGYTVAKVHVPFKVSTTNFSEDPEIKAILDETKKTEEDGKETVVAEADKPKEDLMSAERGFEKEMENNANNVIPEVKEEEVVETPVVETKEVVEEAKAEFSEFNSKFDALSAKVIALEESFAKFSESAEVEEEKKEEAVEGKEEKAEFSDEAEEPIVEAVVEEEVVVEESKEEPAVVEEEAKEEVVEEAETAVEEVKEEEAKAEFSELASKIDKLADAISQKEAAPMSTAEFGAKGNDKGNAVIDRLTNFLTN